MSTNEKTPSVPMEHAWMTAFRRFFSGAISGTATAALLQPLDVIKTTQQSRHLQNMVTFTSSSSSSSSSSSTLPSSSTTTTVSSSTTLSSSSTIPNTVRSPSPIGRIVPKPTGIFRTTMFLVQEQGTKSLWKGLGATIIRVFFGAGIYFVILQTVSDMLAVSTTTITKRSNNLSSSSSTFPSSSLSASTEVSNIPVSLPWLSLGVRSFIAGVSARSIAAAILSPIAVVKTRMEYMDIRHNQPYRNTYQAVRDILRTEGWASLYSGLIPTIARDAPFSGIYYTSYNYLKNLLQLHHYSSSSLSSSSSSSSSSSATVSTADNGTNPLHSIPKWLDPYPTARNFIAGLGGGIIATLVTHPADVLKTRLQLKNAHGQFVDGRILYEEAKYVYRTENITGYFIGLNARIVKRGFSTAITWTLFEEAMRRSGGGGGS